MSEDRFGTLDQYAALIEAPEPSFEGFLRRRRRQRRNKGITAGVAVAVLVVAGSLFIGAGRDDGTGTNRPVGPGPLPTTAPAVDPEMFPPEGAPPSLPETGELVASIWFSRSGDPGWTNSQINLYADGRLLWHPAPDVPGGIAEQHLSADDVERVRSEFLASGLFDPDHPVNEEAWSACACFIWVRDGDRLLSTEAPAPESTGPSDPEVDRQVDQLIASVTALDPSLPPRSESNDPDLRPYVPSRYGVCVYGLGEHDPDPLPNAPTVLRQRLPEELARLLAGVRTGVNPDFAEYACDQLAPDEARELGEGLAAEADVELPSAVRSGFALHPRGAVQEEIAIELSAILPDGAEWAISGSIMPAGTGTTVPAPVARVDFIGLPPEGSTPSTPATGELVLLYPGLAPGSWRWVYADGRLITWELADLPDGVTENSTGFLEQRLTPEGVDLLRSELLAADTSALLVEERDGALYATPARPGPPQVDERLTNPGSWLPASAWEDRDVRPFVPSTYAVSWERATVATLPEAVQDQLGASEVTTAATSSPSRPGWVQSVMTTEDARRLAGELAENGGEVVRRAYGLRFSFDRTPGDASISFEPYLPHGDMDFAGSQRGG